MNPDDLRNSLIALANQARPYEFLHAGLPYLAQSPADMQIRLMAVRCLAELGLFGPAVELIDDQPDLLALAPDLASTAETLRKQPTGLLAWAGLARTFERNLAAVCERFDTCRAHEPELRTACNDLELVRCKDGNLLLSRRKGGKPRQWLPGIVNWLGMVCDCQPLRPDPNLICMPAMIEGVGLGHAVRTLFDNTSKMFLTYTPHIHVLEPNVAQLAAWLHVGDHRDMLDSPRFHVWLGPEGQEAFLEFHRAHLAVPVPTNVIRQPGWGPAAEACGMDILRRLTEETTASEKTYRQTVRASLADRGSPEHYAEHFARRDDRPLRILGLTSRFTTFLQYSMRDIEHAAANLGHEFRLLIEDSDHTPLLRPEYISKQVEDFMPDLILIIDHNRKEYGATYDYAIPFCNWIQDDLAHLFGPGAGEGLHDYDLVVGLVGHNRLRSSGYPVEQCRFVPTPVSLRKFSNEPVPDSDRRAHACDISFVTHLSQTRQELLSDSLAQVRQPEVRRLLEAQYERLASETAAGQIPGTPMQTIDRIQQLAHELGFDIDRPNANRIRQLFTDRLINAYFREQVLEWASNLGLDLHIYGRGWDRHPTLAKHARGPAEHGHQLRCIYQASKLNIQAVSTGAVHQRLIEGLCCGGFFLIRRTPSDDVAPLQESIRGRCVAAGLQTEDELWNTPDEALARDVRGLNDALYAPARLYDGFVRDQYFDAEHGFSMQAGTLLPDYDRVRFGTREEFEQVVTRFLDDDAARREIVEAQRDVAVGQFSYESALQRIFDFAKERFSSLAAESPLPAAAR
ncbi:MAG: hypothetical protein JXQ73_11050 [Phycisphaerae bacterium]|nr:hypothetical protein [Phycisphaerae bacterium]